MCELTIPLAMVKRVDFETLQTGSRKQKKMIDRFPNN